MFPAKAKILFLLSRWSFLISMLSACTAQFSSDYLPNAGRNSTGETDIPLSFSGFPESGFQDKLIEFSPSGSVNGFTFSLENAPSWISVDTANGKISAIPSGVGVTSAFNIVATRGEERQVFGPYTIQVTGDPLSRSAWHLGNQGQNSFSMSGGVAGEDMKVREASAQGFTGQGVKVAVSDTGLEVDHLDLKNNVSLATSKNYGGVAPYLGGNPSPTANGGDHGTSVSGIIAAQGWNGIGTRGVAPEAILSGLNFIPHQDKTGVFLDQITGSYDVFNQSWGSGFAATDPIGYTTLPATYLAQLRATASTGRNGKGSIILRAAGNDRQLRPVTTNNGTIYRQRPANGEMDNAIPWVIVVGAMNATGVRSSYSSTGSNLWISGLAGEFGRATPAMITTDVMGCDRGYSRSNIASAANAFETGTQNTDCNFTSIFNGTSSATPSVAGVVALMLQANPSLTFRDVKHILAKTATKVHGSFVPTQFPLDPVGYISEPNWVTNAAGYHFHNWYGFGRADAEAAVKMAKSYNSQLGILLETVNDDGSWKYSKTVNLPIANNEAVNLTSVDSIAVSENWVIEAVQIEVTLTHPMAGDIGIELVGPSGTKSMVFTPNNAFTQPNLTRAVMLANNFYGEKSAGNWTIRVLDGNAANSGGQFVSWKVNILGHE